MGNSVGALLIPVLAWSILDIGWRETTIAIGVGTIIIGVPLAAVMRGRPEDYGLPAGWRATRQQRGLQAADGSASRADKAEAIDEPTLTVGQSLRGRNFWFLALSHSAGMSAWGALQVHQIPALVDIGIDELQAAGVLSYTLVMAAPGRLIGGFLGDLLGPRKVTGAAFICQGVAVVVLAFATSLTHVMVFATVFGIAFGTRGTLMTVLRAEVFGRENFSRLAGLMDPISGVSVFVTPIVAGLIYDSLGSYQIAFLIFAGLNASGALLLLGTTSAAAGFKQRNAGCQGGRRHKRLGASASYLESWQAFRAGTRVVLSTWRLRPPPGADGSSQAHVPEALGVGR